MKRYVDGFVLVVPKKNLKDYQKIAAKAGKIWMKYGALQYVETAGEDMKVEKGMLSFPKMTNTKPSECVVFSWIVYRNKKHRDAVNKKVMADPEMIAEGEKMEKNMPFDMKKMAYGGFESIVNM